MTNRQKAEKIVAAFRTNLAPGASTFGDNYFEAYHELFKYYREDMIEDILRVIGRDKRCVSATNSSTRRSSNDGMKKIKSSPRK